MPSGGITITPGYQLGVGEPVNNSKLNQGFQPIGQVNEGAITGRELSSDISSVINSLKGRNLLCNGAFQMWLAPTWGPGISGTPYNHDYGLLLRWVLTNDINRAMTRQQFPTGSTEIPDGIDFLRWIQSGNLTVTPAYLGQRLEDVRRFGGATLAFSIYLRPASNLTVTPKVRQVFGSVKRQMVGTISHPFSDGRYVDTGEGFRQSDVGGTLAVTGPGYAQSGTIVTFFDPGLVAINNTAGTIVNDLTALVTSPPGSAAVVTAGDPVNLVAGVWTRLEQVFEVPNVSGKTIPTVDLDSFTEFRVDVPLGSTFQIDFANAQLEFATAATAFERRPMYDDMAYARYYHEQRQIRLSTNIGVWQPFHSFDPKLSRPIITLPVSLISSGTGGRVGLDLDSGSDRFVIQTLNHSTIASGLVVADSEIRD